MVPPKKIWGNGSSVSFCVPLACSHPPSMFFLFFLKRFFVVVQSLSHVRLFATPWTVASLSFTISQSLLKLMSSESMMPSNHLILCCPLSSFPQSPQHQGLFQWVSSLHQVAKVLELQRQSFQRLFRVDFLWDWLVWSPCSPRDSQDSSPTPQLKSINSLMLSLLYEPALTSVHDYWKNHSFEAPQHVLFFHTTKQFSNSQQTLMGCPHKFNSVLKLSTWRWY